MLSSSVEDFFHDGRTKRFLNLPRVRIIFELNYKCGLIGSEENLVLGLNSHGKIQNPMYRTCFNDPDVKELHPRFKGFEL